MGGPGGFFIMPSLSFALFLVAGLAFFASVFAPVFSKWRWLFLVLSLLGLGGVFLWSANLTQPGKVQQPTCNEMAFAPNYKLVILAYPFAFSYSEAILVPTNGLSLITPNMDSLAHVGEYVLGHSTESSPRYFWFNLWTRTIKRYSDEQSARSAEVVQKLGLTGVPELKDADIICSEARCRPCSSEVNVDDLSAK